LKTYSHPLPCTFFFAAQVSAGLALTATALILRIKSSANLLQASHIGTMLSPATLELMTGAPTVGGLLQRITEQVFGQPTPE
jgi:hypothetical protein